MKPGDHIRSRLKEKSWTQEDLAWVLGRPQPSINQIISGKVSVTPETAVQLSSALGETPRYWLELDANYRLSQLEDCEPAIQRRANLLNLLPINSMHKRGWLGDVRSAEEIESTALELIECVPNAAWRKSGDQALTPEQLAWLIQLAKMAKKQRVEPFSLENMDSCLRSLKKLTAFSQLVENVPKVLSDHGIRFVVIEPFSGSRIDGATIWLNEAEPVVGLTSRLDRLDNFWFTLFHELSHVKHRDEFSIDDDTLGNDIQLEVKSAIERRADLEAAELLISKKEMDSFVKRYSPMYSKKCIIQFAIRLSVHPGIVVGQLQARNEIGWNANREMLVKIRDSVTCVAMTDGWGQ